MNFEEGVETKKVSSQKDSRAHTNNHPTNAQKSENDEKKKGLPSHPWIKDGKDEPIWVKADEGPIKGRF